MADVGWSIYTAAEADVTPDLLRTFLDEQRRDRLFMESLTLELKRERSRAGVLAAIAGLANSVGGIVLVGVDESEPSLDSSPGVDPEELVALVEQCRGGLSPVLMPEFIAVAIPETNKIVVVVRVEAVPAHWPVVMNGQVFIRNPGQTIRATHDQILDLVRRRSEAASPTELAFSVASTHSPASVYGEAAAGRGDLFVRLATAVYARPGPGLSVTFGADERLVIDDALNASSFARLIDDAPWRGSQRQRERLRLTADEFSSMHYAAHCEYGDGETRHRLGLRVQRHGLQVSVHIELEARLPRDLSTATTPRVGREELALTALCGLETLSLHMVPALARLVGGAPMHVDDVYLWAESPRIQNLGNAVDVSRVHRPVEGTRTNWIATLSQVGSLEEAVEKVRRPLEAFYLDLGFDEERQVVDDDLRRAVGVRNGLA